MTHFCFSSYTDGIKEEIQSENAIKNTIWLDWSSIQADLDVLFFVSQTFLSLLVPHLSSRWTLNLWSSCHGREVCYNKQLTHDELMAERSWQYSHLLASCEINWIIVFVIQMSCLFSLSFTVANVVTCYIKRCVFVSLAFVSLCSFPP